MIWVWYLKTQLSVIEKARLKSYIKKTVSNNHKKELKLKWFKFETKLKIKSFDGYKIWKQDDYPRFFQVK